MHDLKMLVLGVKLVPEETRSHVSCVLDLQMNSLENLHHLDLYYTHQVTFPKRPWRDLPCLERLVVHRANGFLLAVFSKIATLRSLHLCSCEGLQLSDMEFLGSMFGLKELTLGGLSNKLEASAAEAFAGLLELHVLHLHRTEELPEYNLRF